MNVALCPSLDILSICTGGGGLDLGIELAVECARTVCMVEREAFSVAHLVAAMQQGLMAPCPVWSNARTFDGRAWRGSVDGLIGGIPCQPHSMAGRKRGSLDERDLWSTARRIVVQSRCWFVLIENVGGMLSAGDDEVAGAERVWRDLRKLGFAVEIGLFTAAEVGASHERERVFILGVHSGVGQADAYHPRPQGRRHSGDPVGRQGSQRHAGLGGGELAVADSGGQPIIGIGNGGRSGDARGLRARRDAHGCHPALDDTISRRRPARRDDHGRDDGYEPDTAGEHALVDAEGDGWGERRTEPEFQERDRVAAAVTGSPVGNAFGGRYDRREDDPLGREIERAAAERPIGTPFLFPPGPNHLPRWADVLASSPELEPAFRRVADGLASRLDVGRVDRLRMLGNGVVPLQSAHAFRTLCHRLAERGSAGAARLVRMMHDDLFS